MVGFTIPFKSKEKSKNWELDCALLERTLQSLLNQTDQRFRCFVVYSDLPPKPLKHSNIHWIQFPFPFFGNDQIEDADKYLGWPHLPFFFDQGKKSLFGASRAKEEGCSYIMSLDADDLLSNRLVQFINDQNGTNYCGWYVDKGYLFTENSSLLIKVPSKMNVVCGSVNIIRSDVIPDTDFSINTYENYNFFSAHAYMKTRIQVSHHQLIQPIPFYCLAYVIHSTNEMASKKEIHRMTLTNIAKKILRGKILTSKIKKEFGIYKLPL